MILGDNIFDAAAWLHTAAGSGIRTGAMVFAYAVSDPALRRGGLDGQDPAFN